MKLPRRDFLKLCAAGSAATTLGAGAARLFFETEAAQSSTEYSQQWIPTICLMCPGGCGVLVRTVNGRAVKVEGNPLHPVNTGKVCPKANAALQVLYDPDRIRGPMRQSGERGSGEWQPIGWGEAIRLVAEKLAAIREDAGPASLAIMSGRVRGQMAGLIDRFLYAYGSPNHIRHDSLSVEGERIANELTYGHRDQLAYDWDNCNFVLSFGRAFLEASRPTIRQIRSFGAMRRDRPNRRAKFVQIDVRFSITAAKADEWIPIRPGTDGALALGIANVILAEGLYDLEFVRQHTFGFDDWVDEDGDHEGFRSFVLRNYHPNQVESITGVPADTIVRLAREFATTQPAIATGGRGVAVHSNGVYNWMAIQALNALVGSIEVPGGVMIQNHPPFAAWPDLPSDPISETGRLAPRVDGAGTRQFPLASTAYQNLARGILDREPYPLNALLLYYTNPLYSAPDIQAFYEAIREVPFVVSFSPFLDDSSVFADLILPDHTFLERLQDDEIEPSTGYSVVGLRQPVVTPLFDTRDTGDVLIEIAHAMGGTMQRAFPWEGFSQVVQFRLSGLWASERGSIQATEFRHFWNELATTSVWHDAPYSFGQWGRVFGTPSGKYEFYSQTLKAKLAQHLGEQSWDEWLDELGVAARGDSAFFPHYEAPRSVGAEAEYPFYVNTYKLMTHAEGRGANSPWLQEKLGLHIKRQWEVWVEINPEIAARLGISDDDWVWIESPIGERIRMQAVLYPGARPDTLNIPFEQGHTAYGQWAAERGENPNRIIANENDHLAGIAAWSATRVKVYRA